MSDAKKQARQQQMGGKGNYKPGGKMQTGNPKAPQHPMTAKNFRTAPC